jgi:hypothetical protein
MLVALAAGALLPAAAGARVAPTELTLAHGANSLRASWGVSSKTGLTGFRVRWRKADATTWSRPVELPAWARTYLIKGLAPVPYQVRVRARKYESWAGGALAEGTPLPGEGEELEEPPGEEVLEEEEPAEEPEEEVPAEEEPVEEGGNPRLVWLADPATPILSDWANIAAEPGRVTTLPFAAMPYGDAYSDEVRNGDNPGGYGERSEIAEGNPTRALLEDHLFTQGENLWIAFPFELRADFPINTRSWYVIAQVKQLGGLGTPILSIASNEHGGIGLFNSASNGNTSGNVTRWSGPAKLQQVSKLVLHVKFSPDPAVGFVELFGDLDGTGVKPLMGKTYMSTMKQVAGLAVDDQARLGQYRDAAPKSGTAHVYYGRYAVATSRAVAEAYSFG